MGKEEKLKMIKNLKKGDIVKAKIGDAVVGYDVFEMEFESLNKDESVSLLHKIQRSRFNPKGRIDNYRLALNNLVF